MYEKEYYNILNNISIDKVDYRDLLDESIKFTYKGKRRYYFEDDLDRITVNCLRHNHSNYDNDINRISKMNIVNKDIDCIKYKNCVLDKISKQYPNLKAECDYQKSRLDIVKMVK